MHVIAPGLSRGAGEVNCVIACSRVQFLPQRAVHLCVPFHASANPFLNRQRDTRVKFTLSSLLSTLSKPKASAPRQPWEPFWYFYMLIELRIELVWHISPNQKAQLFRDTQL